MNAHERRMVTVARITWLGGRWAPFADVPSRAKIAARDAGAPHQVECEPEIERDCEIPAGQESCREPPVRHDRRRRGHHEADADRSEKPGPGAYDPEQERRAAEPRT